MRMHAVLATVLTVALVMPGQGWLHSGRCRGQTHPGPSAGWVCTRGGWVHYGFTVEHAGYRGRVGPFR